MYLFPQIKKIAEPKKSQDDHSQKQETPQEPKTKMDIFKEALNISLKNLEIKEEDKQTDNVSVSELSLSQAIFKNARLPPYFGSKEFRAQKFLNLFFDEDMGSEIMSKKQIESMSNKPLSTPSQDNSSTSISSNNTNISSGYLPPPPSLQSLGLLNNTSQPMSGTLPPPPTLPPLNLLPPPPLPTGLLPPPPLNLPNLPAPPTLPSLPSVPQQSRQSVVIDDQDENKQLLESILVSTRSMNSTSEASSSQSQFQESPALPDPPKPVENKPLTFQQELALKLKLGKDYKPAARVVETPKTETREEPKREPEQTLERTNSFRQSTKIQDIIGVAQRPKIKQTNSAVFDDEEEENALFGSGKRKTNSQVENQTSKFGMSKNEADAMMSRSTFNEDMLFKKKPIFSKETVLPTKTQEKPKEKQEKKPNRASVLFNQDSDEEQDFTFKKKTIKKAQEKKPEQQPKKKPEEKKSNPLGMTQKPQVKEKPAEEPKKKNINKLFGGDSDEEGDVFAKKTSAAKKQPETPKPVEVQVSKPAEKVPQKLSNPLAQPKTQKKNSLFNEDEEEDDFAFKPKSKPPVKKQSKKQEKKSSLFGDEQDEDSAFKPKPKPAKKEPEPEPAQEVQKPKPESPQKSKGPPFSSIPEEENQEGSGIFLPKKKTEPEPEIVKNIEKAAQNDEQEESEEAKRMKKIARMGGQPMMGMAQMIPKGMNITKPSQTKENQKIARQNIEHEKQKEKKIHEEEVTESEPKRQLDPLQTLIKQTIKTQEPIPLIKKFEEEPTLPKVPQEVKVQSTQEVTLEVRRKKNKPKRNDDDFDDDEKQVKKAVPEAKSKPQVKEIPEEKQQPTASPKKNPLKFEHPQENTEKASQMQKIAKISMAGMTGMPQMGMGPLMMPKGLVITKPSEAKKLQQQALQRIKQQEQERAKRQQEKQRQQRKRQIQEQLELQRAQEQEQLKLQNLANQKLQRQQAERERQERQAREQQLKEQQLREQQLREQQLREQQLREQQEREHQQRLAYEQQEKQRIAYEEALRQQKAYEESLKQQQELQRQRLAAQEQERKRIEEENQRIRKAQEEELRKQKSSLPSLTAFDEPKKDSNPLAAKNKQSGPLDMPKMPPKVNPLGGSSSKSPLGGPLGGSLGLPKASGPLQSNSGSVPPMPSISRQLPKNTGKKSLFDDDDDDGFTKKKEAPSVKQSFSNANNEKKKASLFGDDDDDSGFGFGSKAKPKKNTGSKKLLFDDDQDEGFGFGKKTKKPQPKESIVQAIIESKPEPKPVAQKSNLLNNDSGDDDMFGKKKPQAKETIKPALVPQKTPEEIKPPQPTLAQKPKNKKTFFGGSDSDSDGGFGKKKINKQPVQAPTLTTNNLTQNQSKPQINPQKQVKSKKGLFGSSDEEEDKKPTKPTMVKETPLPVVSKPTQSKNLFASSDNDDEDDVFKRKPQTKPEPPKPVSKLQNEPLIPSKKAQVPSISPLSGAKTSGPLGFSSSFNQAKLPSQQSNIPATQPKKRNIFQESDEDSSPVVKAKAVQQPAQKKGLMVDYEEQKPQQKLNIMKQQEPSVPPASQSNNNRRLFDDSEEDSDAEQMAKKKRMANSKMQKLF